MHTRVSEKYREEKCDRAGRQERNITQEELRGLKKLEKRKNDGEIVIITTDKSSKMCVMRREDYLLLGEEHVSKDRVIDRQEALKREKLLNQHALAWCRMWRTGENHSHEDRIRQSKVTNSENKAELYLTYKDHKHVPGKTRPIATGCTSNTLALSSSVSTLVESLASSEEGKVEVISTEDLLYNVGNHDKEVEMMRIKLLESKLRKLMCTNRTHGRLENGEKMEEIVEEVLEKVLTRMMIKEMMVEMIVNIEDEEVEVRGSRRGAPNPPVVSGGLLEGGRTLVTQGLTTPQEPIQGGEEERIEENLKSRIKELSKGFKDGELERRMKEVCEDCGGQVEEMELCLLGLDVAALFPSMSAKRTGEIIRRRMMRSRMSVDGFDWRRGVVYIQMNRHLTGNLGGLWKILPYRRKVGGTAPGMGSKGMSGKSGTIEEQWCFKVKELTRDQMMEVVARCTEIAVRTIFENFSYNFGGKVYLQQSGGPIGERLTMACSRVVMAEWGEEYERILREAGLVVTLLRIYVDDVRQASTVLKLGTRFDVNKREMVESEVAREEDERLRKEGETTDARMARILAPVMNSINPDLTFTTEIMEDFGDKRLPTLDCSLWFEEDWSLNHTYFEKSMRSQIVIPENSAMSEKQKLNILSNDLIRRLSNVKIEKAEEGEEQRIIDHYTRQLKTSGYQRRKSREIVVSGVLGWLRKRERREKQGTGFYRSAASTLIGRNRKKLLDPVTWFRGKVTGEEEKEKTRIEGSMTGGRKRKLDQRQVEKIKDEKIQKREDPKAVMFCPYTPGGELAKRLREVEQDMEKNSGYRIKIVEEAGEKVLDILHSSNPWKGEDCGRDKCLLCATKAMTGKSLKQDCKKRSLVYEIWCETCLRRDMKEVEELEDLEETEKEERIRRIKRYKYVGETARSVYERGLEHQEGLEKMSEDNHMMKHVASHHQDMELDDVKFGMKVVRFTHTAMERQVLESVRIQEEQKRSYILNSKAEYSRCTLPRLTAKMGEAEYDEVRDAEKKKEKEMEDMVKRDIARRKKERCKRRGKELHAREDAGESMKQKRRKIDVDGQYKTVVQTVTEQREEVDRLGEKDQKVRSKRVKRSEEEVTEDRDASAEEEDPKMIPYKILGQEIKGAVLEEPIDWQRRRREILDRMREEEEQRRRRIEKAARLQRGWELTVECKRILLEFDNNWRSEEESKEKRQRDKEREEQRGKAARKKEEFKEKIKKRDIGQKITDMLMSIPKSEAEKIEADLRRKENEEFREMKRALWRKWRGKTRIMERKDQVPKEIDKLEYRLKEIEDKIEEYKEKREIQLKRRDMKKEEWKRRNRMIGQDTWSMMTWLTQFIEENKYDWGKRRQREKEPMKEEYEVWSGMDERDMIEMLKAQEETEKSRNESKKDKARRRQKYWKEWRKRGEEPGTQEVEKVVEEESKEALEQESKERMLEMRKRTTEMLKRRKEWEKEKGEKAKKVKPKIDNKPPVQGEKELDLTENPLLDLPCEARPNTENKTEKGVEESKVCALGERESDLREDPELDLQIERRPNIEVEEKGEDEGACAEEEGIGVGGRSLCLTCVHTPCLCALLKLEMKLQNLRKNPIKKKEEMTIGRKDEEAEDTREEATKGEEPENRGNFIMGGGPQGVFPSKQKAPSSNILEGDPPIGKERGALGVGTGPTPPSQPPSPGGEVGVQEDVDRKEIEGVITTKKEKIVPNLSSPPPNINSRNHHQPDLPDKPHKKETLLELMRRKNKEKEAEVPKERKKPDRKKEAAKKKQEEDRKAAGALDKLVGKLKEEKTVAGRFSIVENVNIDRKTVDNEEVKKKAVDDEAKEDRSPPRKFKEVLRKFNFTEKKEDSFEEWKKRKQLLSTGVKRKAEIDEYPGSKEELTITESPGKFLKISGPGMIQKINSIKINNNLKSQSNLAGNSGGLSDTPQGGKATQNPSMKGGGVVDVTPRSGRAIQSFFKSSVVNPLSGEATQASLVKGGGGVGVTPRCGAVIQSYLQGNIVTPQRAGVGKKTCLTGKLHAAVAEGKKTGSGGTLDSTNVQ